MSGQYLTIARNAEAEIEEKRSRFLGQARRVGSEEEARATIEEIRKHHWDARHHCTAFVIGPDGQLARSNDDGEPSGTAGAPILRTLQGRELCDVVVVVTRWFGGILLGAGGLVRAYGDAAAAALDLAGVMPRQLFDRVVVHVRVENAARLENLLRSKGFVVSQTDYGDGTKAKVLLVCPPERAEDLRRLVNAETRSAGIEVTGQLWRDES